MLTEQTQSGDHVVGIQPHSLFAICAREEPPFPRVDVDGQTWSFGPNKRRSPRRSLRIGLAARRTATTWSVGWILGGRDTQHAQIRIGEEELYR